MCDGGLSRLTARYTAAKIVAAAPTMLATLTNRTCMAAPLLGIAGLLERALD